MNLVRSDARPSTTQSRGEIVLALFDQPWTLFAALFVVLLFTLHIGTRVAQLLSVSTDEVRHEQLVAARDAIGLLLSLLLGFTLAMALSRFDQRKQLLVNEANAIGTATLRSRMLPDAARTQMLGLLREYVDARIQFSEARLPGSEFDRSVARAKQLLESMNVRVIGPQEVRDKLKLVKHG